MNKLKFNGVLALLSTVTLVSGSQLVYAQAAVEPEEIVVTGFRSSVLNSVEAKRNSDVVSEVVDAGDLGSLPAVSIADALGRLPGVTTVRDSGQSSQLNLRGMSGDFIQTTLNGREQASTTGYAAGSRIISFDQYPSELIGQAAVYKSPKASQIEGGVAGTVELKTANPLDAEKEHNFSASIRGSYNDAAADVGADEYGSRVSFSYQGKFFDDTLGFGIGAANLIQPNNSEEARAGADEETGYRGWDNNAPGKDRAARSFQFRQANGNDDRLGYLATIVYKPNDIVKASFDYFNSSFESEDTRSGLTFKNMDHTTGHTLTGVSANAQGFVTGATYTSTGPSGISIESRTEDQTTESDTEGYGLNLEFHIGESSTLSVDAGHSEGRKTRLDRIATLHAYEFGGDATGDVGHYGSNNAWIVDRANVTQGTWQELTGQVVSYGNYRSGVPGFSVSTDLTDLSHMRLSEWEQFPHLYTDELDNFRVDYKLDLESEVFSSIEAGIRLSDRTFGTDRSTFRWGQRWGQAQQVDGNGHWVIQGCESNVSKVDCTPRELPAGTYTQESFGGSLSGLPNYLSVDLEAIANAVFGLGNYKGKKSWAHNWTLVNSGKVEEEVFAYYLMANLDSEAFTLPVTGNIGVRVIKTDTKAVGIVQNAVAGSGQPIADGNNVVSTDYSHVKYGPEYTDVLPSLNLNFAVTEKDNVRFALAKVMARPPVDKLGGGAGSWITPDSNPPIYNVWSKGNPNLHPFRASQVDLSYEHYFDDGGAVSVAGFYKDIDTMVENVTYPEGSLDAAGWKAIGLPLPPAGYELGQYQTSRNNDKGGYIRGLELAYSTTFTQLPGVFSGLGLTTSYSYTESKTSIGGGVYFPAQQLPLPGLSRNVWSNTLFWDIGQFSTNANIRYRDDFIHEGDIPGGGSPLKASAYTIIDLQASYKFDNGIEAVIQLNNATDEGFVSSYGSDSVLGEVKEFGRQYFVGINYKY
ncbi:MAG TPA: TonB-dependent receptor [Cellvibrio sp.]|nr:TonB-dependent receptor [Cellvibrio sp.]